MFPPLPMRRQQFLKFHTGFHFRKFNDYPVLKFQNDQHRFPLKRRPHYPPGAQKRYSLLFPHIGQLQVRESFLVLNQPTKKSSNEHKTVITKRRHKP
jgi:hypothetical protein